MEKEKEKIYSRQSITIVVVISLFNLLWWLIRGVTEATKVVVVVKVEVWVFIFVVVTVVGITLVEIVVIGIVVVDLEV